VYSPTSLQSEYKKIYKMSIIHYLTIQSCKRVFFDPDYGVMRSTEPLEADAQLNPLCLLGISVDNLPLKYTKYYHKNDPAISLSAFVKTFWERVFKVSGFNNPIVTGMPDLLVIDHRAKDLIHENFFEWLKINNIEYKFSDSKNRTALAKYLQHQSFPHVGFCEMTEQTSYVAAQEKYALSVDVLNYYENYNEHISAFSKHLKTLNLYQKNIFKLRSVHPPVDHDIDLQSIQPLPSKADRKLENAYWVRADLEREEFGYLYNRQDMDIADSERVEKKAFIAAIKALPESQWQNMFTDEQIALIKIFKKERFKDTKSFDEVNYRDMCNQLGFNNDHSEICLAFDTKSLSRSEMIELWDEYTYGGDVTFSCEILLPVWQNCRSGKTYRFFYLTSGSKSIFFVCTPDSAASKAFDDESCTNHMVKNKFDVRQINEHINLSYFDEMLLNTRQYLLFMAGEMRKFHTLILDYYY